MSVTIKHLAIDSVSINCSIESEQHLDAYQFGSDDKLQIQWYEGDEVDVPAVHAIVAPADDVIEWCEATIILAKQIKARQS